MHATLPLMPQLRAVCLSPKPLEKHGRFRDLLERVHVSKRQSRYSHIWVSLVVNVEVTLHMERLGHSTSLAFRKQRLTLKGATKAFPGC